MTIRDSLRQSSFSIKRRTVGRVSVPLRRCLAVAHAGANGGAVSDDAAEHHAAAKEIFCDGELTEEATCGEGEREVERNLRHYRLEAILAVGFRVRSHRGTQFRQWALELEPNAVSEAEHFLSTPVSATINSSPTSIIWRPSLRDARACRCH